MSARGSGGSVTINVDPEAFKIIDGKLYLGYADSYMQYFTAHAGDEVAKATANWPKVAADLELDKYH